MVAQGYQPGRPLDTPGSGAQVPHELLSVITGTALFNAVLETATLLTEVR